MFDVLALGLDVGDAVGLAVGEAVGLVVGAFVRLIWFEFPASLRRWRA